DGRRGTDPPGGRPRAGRRRAWQVDNTGKLAGQAAKPGPLAHVRGAPRRRESACYSGRMPSALDARIAPARRVTGRIRVPGDKSISHRYALLGALAHGTTELTNYSPGADCQSTLTCLRTLGVAITIGPGGADTPWARTVTIVGRGLRGLQTPRSALDAGNSGTTTRLMSGILAPPALSSTLV